MSYVFAVRKSVDKNNDSRNKKIHDNYIKCVASNQIILQEIAQFYLINFDFCKMAIISQENINI